MAVSWMLLRLQDSKPPAGTAMPINYELQRQHPSKAPSSALQTQAGDALRPAGILWPLSLTCAVAHAVPDSGLLSQ